MDLHKLIINSQKSFDSIDDPSIIQTLSKFEQYVDESYQGRLFFELIQNARDAAFEIQAESEIYIVVSKDKVLFANTGKSFDEGGILAMTRLGLSDKTDKELIGHKGIGFKAIQEFTREPKIITEFGTIYFNRTDFKDVLDIKFPGVFKREKQVPLFSYPFFKEIRNSDYSDTLKAKLYDTIIEFPLNKNKNDEEVTNLFKTITDEELVLLGSVKNINFESETYAHLRVFNSLDDNISQVVSNTGVRNFKVFTPSSLITLPDEVFEKLEENEQDLFQDERSVDIKIAIEMDSNSKPKKQNSKLFLFYPLDLFSGFSYIIHSNFSVNPERTSIRDTPLNEFLFKEISIMQCETILPFLKKHCIQDELIDFLYFERKSEKLSRFYDMYVEQLKEKEFLWIQHENKFVKANEVILCTSRSYELLKNHKIRGLYLINQGEKLNLFLKENFNIPVLLKTHIQEAIEDICKSERNNPEFFERLYSYAIKSEVDLSQKKILLGKGDTLFSGADDVFYATKLNIDIPTEISDKIIILNSGINIPVEIVAAAAKLIGVKEFKITDVVEKALDMLANGAADRFLMLLFLKNLKDVSDPLKQLIRLKINLPARKGTTGEVEWINPLYTPIYKAKGSLLELYPDGYFVDIISCLPFSASETQWDHFFLTYGVWDKPGVYIKQEHTVTLKHRVNLINSKTGKSAYGYHVYNDRFIDFPERANFYFYNAITRFWTEYITFIEDVIPIRFDIRSTAATYRDRPDKFLGITSFAYSLMTEPWIYFKEDQENPFKTDEIFGLNRVDATNEKYLLKFLNVLVVDYSPYKSGLVEALKIKHFNAYTNDHILSILIRINALYADREGTQLENDFKRFYHSVLKYLYNTFNKLDADKTNLLSRLRTVSLLAKDITNGEAISWQKPQSVFHVDDRFTFEQLSPEAKNLLKFFFTKSDKNEIGKIYSRIGKMLSQEVISNVRNSEVIETYKFTDQIKNLPYIIAAVEDKIDDHLPPQVMSRFKETVITIHDVVEKEIHLKSSKGFSDVKPLKYFYDSKANTILLHRDYHPLSEHKTLVGEVIDHVFSNLLEKDIERTRLFKDLINSKGSITFKEALKDFEFDHERLLEIEAIFYEYSFTPAQLFWDAVLFAKGADNNAVFGDHGTIDFQILASLLSCDQQQLRNWDEKMDYMVMNSSGNFPILQEIVSSKSIAFDDINAKLPEPISFEYLYKKEFNIFKNVNLNRIKTFLYYHFSRLDNTRKKQFIFYVDFIEKMEPKEWSSPTLDFNAATDLIRELMALQPEAGFDSQRLADTDANVWISLQKKLPERRKSLKALIKKNVSQTIFFDEFMESASNVSLVYFEQYDTLVKLYAELYPSRPASENDGEDRPLFSVQFATAEEDTKEIVGCKLDGDKPFENSNFLDDALKKIDKAKSGSGGSGKMYLPNQDYIKHIGREGEKILFLKLLKKYGENNVKWVSENCTLLEFTPDREAVGYDIRYIDENHETHYIEVKTSVASEPEFHISINEIGAAKRHGRNYHVIWITNLFNPDKRQYLDLHNMFIEFTDGEDFFHNSKFYPQLTGFKIIFREETVKPIAETQVIVRES